MGESNVDEGEHGADNEWIDGDGGGDGDREGDDDGNDEMTDGGDEDKSQLSRSFLLLIPLSSVPNLTSLVK